MTATYLREWCKDNGYDHKKLLDHEIVELRDKAREATE